MGDNRGKDGKIRHSQYEALKRYKKGHYDIYNLRFPKEMKEEYKKVVESLGYDSFNQFIIDAMDEKIDRESK